MKLTVLSSQIELKASRSIIIKHAKNHHPQKHQNFAQTLKPRTHYSMNLSFNSLKLVFPLPFESSEPSSQSFAPLPRKLG
jgi:hypothetical protein